MKLKSFTLGLLPFSFLAASCAHISTQREVGVTQNMQAHEEENQINNAERLLALGRFEEARSAFINFQNNFPQSRYFQSSRLGEAQAFEYLENWDKAIKIDRDVYLKTNKLQPEIAALASYRMSFAYEATGDDMKALACLLDANSNGRYLPPEISKAEIPARLAAYYGRMGRDQEATKYLNEAEKGIDQVRAEKHEVDTAWLAKTYLQMGTVSTNQLSADTFDSVIESQKMVQVYLIKAIQVNDATWSLRAVDQAKKTYQNLYTLVESQSDRQTQADMGGSLIDLIDQAELFKPLSGQKVSEKEKDFFAFAKSVKTKTENLLYQSKATMSLTEESQKLNGLKRAGRVKAEKLLPEEQTLPIKTPPKIVPTEDPNL